MKHPRTPKPERIQQGRAYLYYGRPYRVGMLNDCRARLDPLFRRRKKIVSLRQPCVPPESPSA